MLIRDPKLSDLAAIQKLYMDQYKDEYEFPFETKNVLASGIVSDGGTLLAFGFVKGFAEAVLFVDKAFSSFKKAKAIDMLLRGAIAECKTNKLEFMHVLVQDPALVKLLMKHHGFYKSKAECLTRSL